MGKENKTMGQGEKLKALVKQCVIVVAVSGILLLLSMLFQSFRATSMNSQQETASYLNQYRLGSKTLTSEVQSYAVTGKQTYYDNYMKELEEDQNREEALEGLKKNNLTDDEWAMINAVADLSDGLVPLEEEAMAYAKAGKLEEAQEAVFGDEYEETIQKINSSTEELIDNILARKARNASILSTVSVIFQVMSILGFAYIIVQIKKTIDFAHKELLIPIKKASEQMGYLAQGDFEQALALEENDTEVGTMVKSINYMKKNMKTMISEISTILDAMGNGDYRLEAKEQYVGEFVEIKEAMGMIKAKMNETLHTLNGVAEQIDAGSEQLSCAAQDLAEGSTTQASQVGEVADAVNVMSKNMEANAVAAEESVMAATEAGKMMQAGNEKMDELKNAISEISKCSEQIETIIAAIEDIASQTNLLSLNAAIEAARAGEAGKGFAVVAEQVKNLAEESAKAAGRTRNLIETTIAAVDKGIRIADETADNMSAVMSSAQDATIKMGTIANMLQEEAKQMEDVNNTISVVSEVVDSNSATSEETAAVSQELKAQVESMVDMMGRFKY